MRFFAFNDLPTLSRKIKWTSTLTSTNCTSQVGPSLEESAVEDAVVDVGNAVEESAVEEVEVEEEGAAEYADAADSKAWQSLVAMGDTSLALERGVEART